MRLGRAQELVRAPFPETRWGDLLDRPRGEDCYGAVEQPKAAVSLAVLALEQLYESHGPKTAQPTPVWVIQHAIGSVRAAFRDSGGCAKNVAHFVVFRPGPA